MSIYGSFKSSSGSTPSESSGSQPDESSGSSGIIDGGSSSEPSSSSSSEACSYYISAVLYGGADDLMEIFLFNDGSVTVTITGITGIAPLSPTPAFPISMLPGAGASFVVDSSSVDLRLTEFTVHTSCGDQVGTFPTNP